MSHYPSSFDHYSTFKSGFGLSNGADSPKCSEHIGMQKGANFTIVSTMVLIGLNIKFYEIFAKQHVY